MPTPQDMLVKTSTVTAPWTIIFPGMAIFFTVLGFNLIGDGLMDILDPKSKGK